MTAVEHLLVVARQRNELEDELAWLDDQAPGLLDIDAESLPPKYRGTSPCSPTRGT
jgi:hypothetical protein